MNSDKKSISASQCCAARALLNWSREELATASKVSRAAIADFETDKRTVRERTRDDLCSTLEAAGVEFIPANGGGPGVRLREVRSG
ncbi:helix-turn-helix domain-containing protein [Methylobacterium phyllosphaerae]